VPKAYAALPSPELRLNACALMCSCAEMIGVSGWSAADKARKGIKASNTMAATAG